MPPFSFFSLDCSSITSFPSSSLLPSALTFFSPSPSGSRSAASGQLFFWVGCGHGGFTVSPQEGGTVWERWDGAPPSSSPTW